MLCCRAGPAWIFLQAFLVIVAFTPRSDPFILRSTSLMQRMAVSYSSSAADFNVDHGLESVLESFLRAEDSLSATLELIKAPRISVEAGDNEMRIFRSPEESWKQSLRQVSRKPSFDADSYLAEQSVQKLAKLLHQPVSKFNKYLIPVLFHPHIMCITRYMNASFVISNRYGRCTMSALLCSLCLTLIATY